MYITLEWLKDNNACKEGINFAIRNKLIGFPFELLREAEGDYEGFLEWVRYNKNNIIHHYYQHGLPCVMTTNYPSSSYWYFYDAKGNLILQTDSFNETVNYEYDDNNNEIYSFNNQSMVAITKEYDCNNNVIYIRESTGLETWYEYNNNNNRPAYSKSKFLTSVSEHFIDYDHNNNIIKIERDNGFNSNYKIEYYPDGQLKQYNLLYIPYFEKV